MIKQAPFGAADLVLGCSVLFFLIFGIFGIVLSLFVEDSALASMIRNRCILGIGIGILIIVIWKIVKRFTD